MTAEGSSTPGMRVRETREFTLFFHAGQGDGPAPRKALQDSLRYRPREYELLFDADYRRVEEYGELPDLEAVKKFALSAQQTAGGYARNYGGSGKENRKAKRVHAAFQRVLDDPAVAELLRAPAMAPLLAEAAD